jgi:hypothetical protein
MQAWAGAAVIGVANGILRASTYGKQLPDTLAHQISTLTAVTAFAGYFRVLDRRWPVATSRQAREIGLAWFLMTVCFEFALGRFVGKLSWKEMLADYDLRRGRTWPVVLAWLAVGPSVVRSIRMRRVESDNDDGR